MSIEAMKQALEALEESIDDVYNTLNENLRFEGYKRYDDRAEYCRDQIERHKKAIAALRQAIQEATLQEMSDIGQEIEQEPVTHAVIAGVLFDFMGWLTSRRTRLCLSDSDNAIRAADAIVDFAKMRGLRLEDAQVEDWQAILTTPPKREQAEKQEPVACVCGEPTTLGVVHRTDGPCFHYTAPPKREWVGLTDKEIADFSNWVSCIQLIEAVESKLKERNT